jgi:monoamine oxidase
VTAVTDWTNYDTSSDALLQRQQDNLARWDAEREMQRQNSRDASNARYQKEVDRRDIERMVERKIKNSQNAQRAFDHPNNDGFKTPTIDPKQTPVIHSMWLIVIIVAILAWRRR